MARVSRDLTNQNATQFENTETEKGPGRERRHERGKNKVTDADATTEGDRCKSFKLRKTHFRFIAAVIRHEWQHSERQGKLYCLPIKMEALMIQSLLFCTI